MHSATLNDVEQLVWEPESSQKEETGRDRQAEEGGPEEQQREQGRGCSRARTYQSMLCMDSPRPQRKRNRWNLL